MWATASHLPSWPYSPKHRHMLFLETWLSTLLSHSSSLSVQLSQWRRQALTGVQASPGSLRSQPGSAINNHGVSPSRWLSPTGNESDGPLPCSQTSPGVCTLTRQNRLPLPGHSVVTPKALTSKSGFLWPWTSTTYFSLLTQGINLPVTFICTCYFHFSVRKIPQGQLSQTEGKEVE